VDQIALTMYPGIRSRFGPSSPPFSPSAKFGIAESSSCGSPSIEVPLHPERSRLDGGGGTSVPRIVLCPGVTVRTESECEIVLVEADAGEERVGLDEGRLDSNKDV